MDPSSSIGISAFAIQVAGMVSASIQEIGGLETRQPSGALLIVQNPYVSLSSLLQIGVRQHGSEQAACILVLDITTTSGVARRT